LKSGADVFIGLEVLISSWYLDPLKTPDIGKVSQHPGRFRDKTEDFPPETSISESDLPTRTYF
jgi:hypothetical protein